jgi:tRNA 2-thiouridine synthesizing protein A
MAVIVLSLVLGQPVNEICVLFDLLLSKGKDAEIMKPDFTLDCYGLLCPMPVFKASQKIKELETGQILEIISTDDGIKSDIKAWCEKTGNELLKIDEDDGEFHTFVRKLAADD